MLTRDKFNEIMLRNRTEAGLITDELISCTNGTSEEVLEFLRSLNDPLTMENTVNELASNMNLTFCEVHRDIQESMCHPQ